MINRNIPTRAHCAEVVAIVVAEVGAQLAVRLQLVRAHLQPEVLSAHLRPNQVT